VAEACPLTTQKMRRVQKRWRQLVARGEHQGKRLTLLSITLDPDFDTPERLREYAEARGLDLDTWILVTGPRDLVQNALPSMFNVLALPRGGYELPRGGGSHSDASFRLGGEIQHTVKAVLLRPGLIPDREWTDDELAADQVIDAILHPAPIPQ
jgi:cytochrome oxidase Cu insertion factor (SCO1/SenC/PrrC family)